MSLTDTCEHLNMYTVFCHAIDSPLVGSLALATKGQYMTGVSTDIGTSFVRPAGRTGDVLHVQATLAGMGEAHSTVWRAGMLSVASQENPSPILASNSQVLEENCLHMDVSSDARFYLTRC